jgi:hypothetical protein
MLNPIPFVRLQKYEIAILRGLEPLILQDTLTKTPVVETCWENERNPNDRDPENLLTAKAVERYWAGMPKAVRLALIDRRTGFQPVRADSASRQSADESARLEARRPRQAGRLSSC